MGGASREKPRELAQTSLNHLSNEQDLESSSPRFKAGGPGGRMEKVETRAWWGHGGNMLWASEAFPYRHFKRMLLPPTAAGDFYNLEELFRNLGQICNPSSIFSQNRIDRFPDSVASLAGVFHVVMLFLIWILPFHKEASSRLLKTVGCNSNLY